MEITLDAASFIRLNNIACKTISKERPILSYICLEIDSEKVTAVSCDGYGMSIGSVAHNLAINEPFALLYKPLPAAALRGAEAVVLRLEDEIGHLIIKGSFECRFSFIQADHIKWRSIKDENLYSPDFQICFDASRMINLLTSYKKVGKLNEVKLGIALKDGKPDKNKAIILSGGSDDLQIESILLPIRCVDK